ncbi:hypothetical protein M0804_010671 [Polistes exclamans]|nr:hypothetical protein M0804_010671 [Polistes exclamans]
MTLPFELDDRNRNGLDAVVPSAHFSSHSATFTEFVPPVSCVLGLTEQQSSIGVVGTLLQLLPLILGARGTEQLKPKLKPKPKSSIVNR